MENMSWLPDKNVTINDVAAITVGSWEVNELELLLLNYEEYVTVAG